MKLVNLKSSTYTDFNVEKNEKDSKSKIGEFVIITKHKNIIAKVYTPNCSEEVFVIKRVKSTVSWKCY